MKARLTAEATRVAADDNRVRYDGFAMALHWATMLLVVLQFALAELWGFASRPTRHGMIVAHMSFGILLTLVLLARICWRLTPGHRVQDATTGLVELASKAVHYLLYFLLAAQAVLGFVLRWSGNEAMSLFGLLIPPPFAPFSKSAHHLVGEAHNWTGWAIIVLAAAHAAAALFHHYVLRDDVLWRMLPGIRRRHADTRAPDARVASKEAGSRGEWWSVAASAPRSALPSRRRAAGQRSGLTRRLLDDEHLDGDQQEQG